MLAYRKITLENINEMADLFVESFNASPWNEKWTKETASKRLHQMINVEDFYGLCAYEENEICGMILGRMEQYYDGMVFQIKEFCIKNTKRGRGFGSVIFQEFKKRLKEKGIIEIYLMTKRGEFTEDFYRKQDVAVYTDMIIMGKRL